MPWHCWQLSALGGRASRRARWNCRRIRRISGTRRFGPNPARFGFRDRHPRGLGRNRTRAASRFSILSSRYGFAIARRGSRVPGTDQILAVLMATSRQYDALIIGSGQAGTPLSMALAASGMRTALIERKHVGGTCVNEGCTPTKTMVASGRVAYLARRGADYGVHTDAVRVDLRRVRERKRAIVDSFRNGSQAKIEKTANLELIFGEARFVEPHTVAVRRNDGSERLLAAKYIFINAGSRASRPHLDGIDTVETLDNISIMELDTVPAHLMILGGGYIGLEFGQLFRRFARRGTIVQTGTQLLEGEDQIGRTSC